MPRLSADTWETVRAEREASGTSFRDLAAKFGVSDAAIVNRSKAEGWSDGKNVADVIRRKVSEKISGVVSTANPKKKAAAIDAAATKVAAVVELHQEEWRDHRAMFGSVPEDFEAGKHAKISAEMLSIRQKGERAAHGLDEPESKGGVVVQWASVATVNG
jgi:hypothetical protein